MKDLRLERVKEIHGHLRKITKQWAARQEADLAAAAALRREAIQLNHQRYIDLIPIYRSLSDDMGAPENPDVEFIAAELASTDDLFKSYNPEYLEKKKFVGLNNWLETLYTGTISFNNGDVDNISQWIVRLAENGVYSTFSSGTSGRLSFVPRDAYNWDSFMNNSAAYIPHLFEDLEMTYSNFDSFSLSFRGGNMGVGLVGQRISQYATNAYFLYDAEISPDALRVMRMGAANEEEQKALDAYRDMIFSDTQRKFDDFIDKIFQSTEKERRNIKIFGAPFQLKQLCERMLADGRTLKLLPKSTFSFGGGWKTFEGEKIERPRLIEMVKACFGIEERYIFEGYSMTELNISMMRCPAGRYHLPPMIEPVIYNEELMPLAGDQLTGTFGYLDPYATSYPGFIISGDVVTMINEKCPCGRIGPAITGEVSRAAGREVKGCGGIMGDMKA